MTIFRSLFSLFLALQVPLAEPQWKVAEPDFNWSFPQDHWAHSGYRTEWWYFTGHLASTEDPGRRFGYQFTMFRIGLQPEPSQLDSKWATHSLIMAHAAISDLSGQRHVFSEVLYREISLLGGFGTPGERLIAWSLPPAGGGDRWELLWNGAAFDFQMSDPVRGIALNLSTTPAKPLVLQGPNGYSRKGKRSSAASQYYSFTRLKTQGTLLMDGTRFQVEGVSWMDKEFGSNQLAENQVGWDWFSLQLDAGQEIMLYHLRDRSGASDFSRGTWVFETGKARYLKPEEWSVQVTGHWTSPATGAVYPARWKLTLGDVQYEIIPLLAEQENRSRLVLDLYYWEGAVSILNSAGEKIGQGYVELTGYGTNNRPPV